MIKVEQSDHHSSLLVSMQCLKTDLPECFVVMAKCIGYSDWARCFIDLSGCLIEAIPPNFTVVGLVVPSIAVVE